MAQKEEKGMLSLVLVLLMLGFFAVFFAGVWWGGKEIDIGAFALCVGGTVSIACAFLIFYNDVQPTIPTEIPQMNGQALRVIGKVPVENACGKWVIVAQKEDGTLVDFCTSQDVGGIFKVLRGDGGVRYVPYAPFSSGASSAP